MMECSVCSRLKDGGWFNTLIHFRAIVGFLNGEILKQSIKIKWKLMEVYFKNTAGAL